MYSIAVLIFRPNQWVPKVLTAMSNAEGFSETLSDLLTNAEEDDIVKVWSMHWADGNWKEIYE